MPAGPVPAPVKPHVPLTVPSTADRAALVAVWALPLLAAVVKLTVPGWIVVIIILWSPVVLAVLVAGIVTFASTFRRRSRVRAALGVVPPVYHVLAWVWGAAFVIAAAVVADGGDVGGWSSPLLKITGLVEPDWYPTFADPVVTACVVAGVAIPVATWALRIRHRPRTAALPQA
ncbi:hypothetical protein GCM10023113_20250 [Cellulomonas oligotrophica]